jgi:hypothetical protein
VPSPLNEFTTNPNIREKISRLRTSSDETPSDPLLSPRGFSILKKHQKLLFLFGERFIRFIKQRLFHFLSHRATPSLDSSLDNPRLA